ncbi:MAG TPA: hypothetical protein VF068_14645, partial [Rubrobacter sp.]
WEDRQLQWHEAGFCSSPFPRRAACVLTLLGLRYLPKPSRRLFFLPSFTQQAILAHNEPQIEAADE